MKSRYIILMPLLFCVLQSFSQSKTNRDQQLQTIKIACVGASITEGVGTANKENDSYPAQLQKLLGNKYKVYNYGVSGCTMLRNGNLPYWNTSAFKQALSCEPNIVFIDLGGNDSKWINRIHAGELERDCADMVDSFRNLTSHPRVILLLPAVSFAKDTSEIWDPAIVKSIIPHIQQTAYQLEVEVIDIHSLLIDKPALFPDNIHPNTQGAAIIAQRLTDLLIQPSDVAFNVFDKIEPAHAISSYYGYQCADFMLNGHQCKVVRPKWSAPGHPWIWRARFWGHEPQTEIALLERGFHVAYCDVAELFGNNEAISIWNNFYEVLNRAGLSSKAVMEGMSRGAVYVYNWAAVNPGKVVCTYVDNPVLDLKSWPCGLGKRPVSDKEFETFKIDYKITDSVQLIQFKGSPVDKVDKIVAGKYAMLILCADADEAVPPEENTLLFEQKVKALKGNITVIHKPGFKHHPHSLPNPAPIVEFILKSTIKQKV